jgi:uncharacterized tellurite resistance protein B-like protein
MFLSKLSENEKKAFVFIAQKIASADHIVTVNEESLLNAFLLEMGLSAEACNFSEDESIKCLIAADNKVKRAVYIELLSIAISDADYCEKEDTCLRSIAKRMGLPDNFIARAKEWLEEYTIVLRNGYGLIEG